MTCQKSARARRGLAHPQVTGGGVNEPDPPLATVGAFARDLPKTKNAWACANH